MKRIMIEFEGVEHLSQETIEKIRIEAERIAIEDSIDHHNALVIQAQLTEKTCGNCANYNELQLCDVIDFDFSTHKQLGNGHYGLKPETPVSEHDCEEFWEQKQE